MAHKLYAAPLSLYSGKARAYLDWKGVDYEEILSSTDVYKRIIVPKVGRPVIPVMETEEGETLQDTTLIIDHYEATIGGPSVYPETPKQRLAALLLELFGDEWLVIPAMHYRWNYNEEWVYGEFGATAAPDASKEEQLAIGRERGANFKGFCPVLGINPQTIPAIEAGYEALLADLDAHFSVHDYLFGSRPSIGDYGLIGPLYAHLYRDPASGAIMKRLAPRVAAWVERMVDVQAPLSGEFLPNDEVPETLIPVLERMMDEQMPFLQTTADMLASWSEANPETELPRAVGMAEFTIEGVSGQRIAAPFSLWMLQRALDYYRGLEGGDKSAADEFLSTVNGASTFRNFTMERPLRFENFRLSLG
ncbi:glutathione S-transferase [Parasphingorhabdus flavimaris]|jgi:glutathione S-transferase|uniref:Glutathione S-transferase n=1 Tax=Parasphingorhabdus flavimaris TaxID=266812 RepID=A0ABX2N644_9SPHN|nr:glutathione S-transferase [Parasphingorhabdus flavimaris]NVD29191.1 glutathione S-transferase [Parasphingorhabdus flavimaris]